MGNQESKLTPPDSHEPSGRWITLMDYATKKSISLSTLRRHIKAQKLTYKIEDGRYLLWDCESSSTQPQLSPGPRVGTDSQTLHTHLYELTRALKQAQEEIAELKTLIALYEETISPKRLDN